jgi:signal peptidase I
MKLSLRPSALVLNFFMFVGLAIIWTAFAPTSIGGGASYVMVNGISMEPGYHLGDLTVMRRAPDYQVGDIVTYRDSKMQAYVIHRIIGVNQDHFILKGDNNHWIDAYRPTRDEIIGKLWIHIPKLGRVFRWLRAPLNLALTVGLLGGVLMINMIKPDPRKREKHSAGGSGDMLEGGLYLFGVLTLVFLGLAIFAFTRPLTRPADKIKYQQESRFTYSATGTPVIYDTNVVRSGEPVFPRLTCFLNIGFTYNILGDQLQNVSGTHQLVARVVDEQSGWQRTIPMNQPAAFTGNTFSSGSTLDLCQIVALVNTLKQETGMITNMYMLEIIPKVAMTAASAGTQISDSLEPKLVFRFDEVHFSLSTPKGQDDPLNLTRQGAAQNPNMQANTLSVLSIELSIFTVRMLALLGLGVSAGGLAILGMRVFSAAQQGQEALIRLRYGALLVNVYERDLEPASTLIDVTTIDELAKLAERHNTVILHMRLNFLHCYLVQTNGITYRYLFSAGRRNTPVIEPQRREMVEYAFDMTQPRIVETGPAEVIRQGHVTGREYHVNHEARDTVIMRRIKL